MAQPYVGEIRMFAGNFPPNGWMFCEGQFLPISEYETLFNLIGTTYGGDGQSNFALPDMRGRLPMQPRAGQQGFTLAETGGAERSRYHPARCRRTLIRCRHVKRCRYAERTECAVRRPGQPTLSNVA